MGHKKKAIVTKEIFPKKHVDDLRKHAEKKIPGSADSIGKMSLPGIQKLVHELSVHKIELEMQNEALRESQAATAESQYKYSDLYDFAPVGYFTFDRKGHIIEANVTGASLLGAEKRSLAKQPFQRFIVPGHFSIFQSHLQKAHQMQSKQTCKLKLTGKDGSLFDALIDTIVVIDGEGKFDHYRSTVIDITEITRAEEALRESEERYRYLVRHAPTGIYEVDFTTRKFLSVNDAMCQYTGYTREEFLSMDPIQLLTEESQISFTQRHAKVLAGEPVTDNVEFHIKRKNGSEFWALLNTHYSYEPNDLILATVIAHDIADRKLAEELLHRTEENFRHSLDDSPLGVRIVTVEGETIYANRAILDFCGYGSIEELKAAPIIKRYIPESFAEFQTRKEKRIRGDYSPSEYEISIARKDGQVRHLHVFRKEVLWDGERQFQVLYNDITERKRVEETLRERDIQFKKLSSWVPGMIYQFTRRSDGTYCVPFATETIKDIFGCSPQDVREDFAPIARVILPEDFDKVASSIEYSAKHLTTWSCEYRVQIPGQPIRWLLGNSSPEKLTDGSVTWYGFNTDITERKQAEAALRDNEEKYRALAFTVDSMYLVNRECCYQFMNAAHLLRLGMSLDEVTGKAYGDFHSEEDTKQFAATIEAVFETGNSIQAEHKSPRDDSFFLRTFSPVRSSQGDITTVTVISKDITKRKQAEYALLLSEHKFKELFESMSSSVAVYEATADGEDFIVTDFNKAAEEAEQIDRKDVIGKSVLDFFPGIRNMGLFEVFQRVWRTGKPEHVPVSLYRDRRLEGWRENYVYKLPTGEIVAIYDDVTDRKKAEDTLRESEARFANIFNASPVAIAITRLKDNRLVDVNLTWQKVTGYTREEVIGRTPIEFNSWVNPGERDRLTSAIREQGTVRNFPFQLRHKSGNVFEMLMSAELIELAGKRYMLSLAQDITELRHAEEALRESEITYRGLYNSTHDGIAMTNIKGNFIQCNRAFLNMLGYPGKEIKNITYQQTTPAKWHNMERNIVINKILKKGYSDVYEKEYIRKDGTVFPVSMRVWATKDEAGNITGLWAIIRDITERKRLEELLKKEQQELKLIINSSPIIVFYKDKEGKFLRVNKAFTEALKLSEEEIVKKTVFDLYSTKIAEGMTNDDQEVIKSGHPKLNIIEQYESASGIRWVQTDKIPICDKNGIPFALIGFSQDITDRKRIEENLRETHERAEWLAQLPEENPNPVMRVSTNGIVLYCNPASVEIPEWACDVGQQLPEPLVPLLAEAMTTEKEIQQDMKLGERFYSVAVAPIHGKGYANVYGRDITEHKLAEEAIKASRQQLRTLAGRLQSAREEQRKQIAREIHDELGGALTALKIDLSSLASSAPKSRDKTKRDSFLSKMLVMTKLIDETIGTVRKLVTELRPSILDDFGLLAALEWQLQEFQKRTGIQTEFVSTLEYIKQDEKLSIAVFRIFQEALTNVARHANATKVTATLYKEADSLLLKVEDNGKGIRAADIHNTKSVGLIGMRERALFLGGTVDFSGEPSKGTTVSVQFPFES